MDAFKRTTLLSAQLALQQITQAEAHAELPTLIDQMKADSDAAPPPPEETNPSAPAPAPMRLY